MKTTKEKPCCQCGKLPCECSMELRMYHAMADLCAALRGRVPCLSVSSDKHVAEQARREVFDAVNACDEVMSAYNRSILHAIIATQQDKANTNPQQGDNSNG